MSDERVEERLAELESKVSGLVDREDERDGAAVQLESRVSDLEETL